MLQISFTGPIARGIRLVAIAVGGLLFAFGEGHSKHAMAAGAAGRSSAAGRRRLLPNMTSESQTARSPLPDVRIEDRTADGETARVDLELTTEHYKAGQIAAKARAASKLYAPSGAGSSGGSPVREEHEITAGILSI